METSGRACPQCGGSETQSVESAWDARHDEPRLGELAERITPPVPRSAATNAGWFYLLGFLGLVVWILAMIYVSSIVAARAASVFFVSCVAAVGVAMIVVRIFTGSPRPTADQIAALDEWKAAHREWQRKYICLSCRETFLPRADEA